MSIIYHSVMMVIFMTVIWSPAIYKTRLIFVIHDMQKEVSFPQAKRDGNLIRCRFWTGQNDRGLRRITIGTSA